MSRFSKAAAEAAGWTFYHDSEEVVLNDGNNESGVTKTVPASVRAEKYILGSRTTEEAPTLGLLLERINAFEESLKSRGLSSEGEPEDAPEPDSSGYEATEATAQDFGDGAIASVQEFGDENVGESVIEKPNPVGSTDKPAPKRRSRRKV